jgi:Protein of unknown function (DUF3800)
VQLVYVDDSSDNSDIQVIVAVIVPDDDLLVIEQFLGDRIETCVPDELRPKFEFHAFKLWKREDEFACLNHEQVKELFSGTIEAVADSGIQIVYGAVSLKALRASYYSTAQPVDVAFRLCMEGLHDWFDKKAKMSFDFGILICDEMKPHVKKDMQQAYRAFRKGHTIGEAANEKVSYPIHCLHDDLYFGDSAYSVGLQLADMCAFLIRHHLQGNEETAYLYKQIEPKIHFSKIEPSQEK